MRRLSLSCLVLLLAGCDTALDPIGGSTDPDALALGDPWVAVEAVVDGERTAFPAEGYTLVVRDGTLGGAIPPNGYGAQRWVAFRDGRIRIEEIVTTLVGGPEHSMRLGHALTSALRTADRFEVTEDELALFGPDGDGIRFRR